jgi:hypothetical protein
LPPDFVKLCSTECFIDLGKGGSILSSSQFLLLPLLPKKIKLASKVVKINNNKKKIIGSLKNDLNPCTWLLGL